MPSTILVCGAECALPGAGGGAATPNHILTYGAGVSVQSGGGKTKGRGSKSWKFAPAAGTTDQLYFNLQSSVTRWVVRFDLLFVTLPNGIRTLASTADGLGGIRYDPTGTQITAWAGAATTVRAGSFVPQTGIFYQVELLIDHNGTTFTTDWRIDGVAQTQASKSGQSAAAAGTFRFGSNGTGQGGNASATAEYYIDNISISFTAADYPTGVHDVVALYPNADGTHSFNAVTDFKYENTTNMPSTTPTDTWTHLQNPLSLTIGNFLADAGGASTEYLEWTFADLPDGVLTIDGYTLVLTAHAAGTSSDNFNFKIVDSTGSSPATGPIDPSEATISQYGNTQSKAADAATTLTVAIVNSMKLQWGLSTDISPVPFIDGACLEVSYVPDDPDPWRSPYPQLLAH